MPQKPLKVTTEDNSFLYLNCDETELVEVFTSNNGVFLTSNLYDDDSYSYSQILLKHKKMFSKTELPLFELITAPITTVILQDLLDLYTISITTKNPCKLFLNNEIDIAGNIYSYRKTTTKEKRLKSIINTHKINISIETGISFIRKVTNLLKSHQKFPKIPSEPQFNMNNCNKPLAVYYDIQDLFSIEPVIPKQIYTNKNRWLNFKEILNKTTDQYLKTYNIKRQSYFYSLNTTLLNRDKKLLTAITLALPEPEIHNTFLKRCPFLVLFQKDKHSPIQKIAEFILLNKPNFENYLLKLPNHLTHATQILKNAIQTYIASPKSELKHI